MNLPKDYDETVGITGDFETLEPGGYICKIVNAKIEKSKNDKDMLVIAFDIASGEHAGIYQKRFDQMKKSPTNDPSNPIKWPNNAVHRIMIYDSEGKCNRFFKGFITSVEESNSGFIFKKKDGTADEKSLKDKLFGALIGREQYEGNGGKLKFSPKIRHIRSTQVIEDGKYEIPEDILLSGSTSSIVTSTNNDDDDDLPF